MFDGGVVHTAFGALFTGILLAACVTDLRSRRIPNALVLCLLVGGLIFAAASGAGSAAVWQSVLGCLLGFAIWIVFYMVGVLGAGDVKLAAGIGAWLGVSGIWRASLLAALVGGLIAIAMLVRERRATDTMRRLITGVSVGSLTLLTARDAAPVGDGRAKHGMPYGVALAVGAIAIAWIPGLLL